MKKITTLLFGLIFLGSVQIASAAYDLTNMTGTIKKLQTCQDDDNTGMVLLWLEESGGNISVFLTWAATDDTDESQVRKNMYSAALAAYLAKESVEVNYIPGTGTRCEVTYDYDMKGISLGTL